MKRHIFNNICIDFNAILADTDFKRMLRVVKAQSILPEVQTRVNVGGYKDYNEASAQYFGMFVEWYAQHYLNHFGWMYNLQDVSMYNSVGSAYKDNGIDGVGTSVTSKHDRMRPSVVPKAGSPVYIQVKGTTKFNDEHMTNDGSRLPNFTTNAMSMAIQHNCAYQARYILFTTAKGVHYRLNEVWNNMVQVISIKEILQVTTKNNNILFLNIMRESVGLDSISTETYTPDAEAFFNNSLAFDD